MTTAETTTTTDTPAAGETAAATPETVPASDATRAAAADTTTADTPGETPASKDGAPGEQPKAPETYTLTVPEGGFLDDADRQAIEAFARTNQLTNDDAQLALTRIHELRKAETARFLAETTADPTYGGDHLAATQQRARQVLEKVRPAGTPRGDALRQLLDKSGYGNHIEVISLLADLGSMMAEDTPLGQITRQPETRSLAERMYPNAPA